MSRWYGTAICCSLSAVAVLALLAKTRGEDGGVDRLIAQLDSGRFEERRQAEIALERIGEAALPALQRALADRPNLELRRRAERLVAVIEKGVRIRALAARLLQDDAPPKLLDDPAMLVDIAPLVAEIKQRAEKYPSQAETALRAITHRQRIIELVGLLSGSAEEAGKAESDLEKLGVAALPLLKRLQEKPIGSNPFIKTEVAAIRLDLLVLTMEKREVDLGFLIRRHRNSLELLVQEVTRRDVIPQRQEPVRVPQYQDAVSLPRGST
jgi:hypothetical protein